MDKPIKTTGPRAAEATLKAIDTDIFHDFVKTTWARSSTHDSYIKDITDFIKGLLDEYTRVYENAFERAVYAVVYGKTYKEIHAMGDNYKEKVANKAAHDAVNAFIHAAKTRDTETVDVVHCAFNIARDRAVKVTYDAISRDKGEKIASAVFKHFVTDFEEG